MLNRIAYYKSCVLSPREIEVYNLLLEGKGQKEIAQELKIAVSTANTHLQIIYQKKFANGQKELMARRIKELEGIVEEVKET